MNTKNLLSLILVSVLLLTLASCKLVRKIEKTNADTDINVDTEFSEKQNYDTDFQSSASSKTDETIGSIKDEDAAYEFLLASFGEEDKKHITLEKTGDMTAQSNGNEYFIIKAEKSTVSDETEKTETVLYYVSVNGLIYTELEEANATTSILKESFYSKYGEKDSATGSKYKLEYAGLIQNKGEYCFNFKVLLEDEGGDTTYKTNFIVSLDGKASALQALEN